MKEICKAAALWMSVEISASILWDHGINRRVRKGSWTLSILKWPCLANGLVLFLAGKGSSSLAKSFPFLILYHHLIRITYGKITTSLCHCPQTLSTSWNFRSRDVKSNLLQPEHWSWLATLLCIILMWMLPSHLLLASWKLSQEPLKNNKNLYQSLAKWIAVRNPWTQEPGPGPIQALLPLLSPALVI